MRCFEEMRTQGPLAHLSADTLSRQASVSADLVKLERIALLFSIDDFIRANGLGASGAIEQIASVLTTHPQFHTVLNELRMEQLCDLE